MLLESLRERGSSEEAAQQALRLISDMYPICRSIAGDGLRRTLDLVEQWVSLDRTEVPTGTRVLDWEVPREWNVRDAYVADAAGRRVIDFRAHNLHVLNGSVPVDRTVSLEELQSHLHSLPDKPDWIPFRRTGYYEDQWGFCVSHRDRLALGPGPYRVVIDSTLEAGHLTLGEAVIEGSGSEEAIVYTHICHPSLVNDNLTGIAVAALIARALGSERPRLTWRFVFGSGAIGSITWLARNEHRLPALRAGLVIGLLGDPAPLTYKKSRRGDTLVDRAASHVLRRGGHEGRIVDFEPFGYDERQFCSPGFDLPVGRLTRSPNGAYPQYHTSADDLSLAKPECLAGSIRALADIISVIDADRRMLNLSPKGEPSLRRRGLYGGGGGVEPGEFDMALLWALSLSDGTNDLIEMSERSGLEFDLMNRAVAALEEVGLLRPMHVLHCTAD